MNYILPFCLILIFLLSHLISQINHAEASTEDVHSELDISIGCRCGKSWTERGFVNAIRRLSWTCWMTIGRI
jgi:hypothetical protein